MNNQVMHQELVIEAKRRLLDESFPRLVQCIKLLNEQELWYRPNLNTNSAGNIILHLCGNVKQWILSGLGNHPDTRNRQKEFETKGPLPAGILLNDLDQLKTEVEDVLNQLSIEQLMATQKVQGFEETGLAILIHVIEHFSYHVGQVSYIVKSLKNIDLEYYKGKDLNRIN